MYESILPLLPRCQSVYEISSIFSIILILCRYILYFHPAVQYHLSSAYGVLNDSSLNFDSLPTYLAPPALNTFSAALLMSYRHPTQSSCSDWFQSSVFHRHRQNSCGCTAPSETWLDLWLLLLLSTVYCSWCPDRLDVPVSLRQSQ